MYWLYAILLAAALLCPRVSAFTAELPTNESELSALLDEQIIDLFQYEQLLVFYALPLSVPQGELAYLIRAFPDIEELLPDEDTLARYAPFDNRQVQRLFGDFPTLSLFEPILRFNESASDHASNGEVIFGINKSPTDELRGQRVRFRYKTKHISTEGAITLSDTGAAWQSRRIEASYKGITAHFGNYRQPIPGDLIYGRFAPLKSNRDDGGYDDYILKNWLYANSGTWNGASVNIKNIPRAPMLGATAFGHIRPGERIGGGGIDFYHGQRLRLFAGATGVKLMTDGGTDIAEYPYLRDYLYTAHLYGEYKGKVWHASAETGLPLNDDGENMTPALSARLRYRQKNSSAEYRLISYPENFTAPLSRVKRRTLSEIGLRDTALSPSVRKHSLRTVVPIIEAPPPRSKSKREAAAAPAKRARARLVSMMRLTPEIEFTESGEGVRRVQGRAELRARGGAVDAAVRHTSRIFTEELDSMLHTSGASVSLQTNYPLNVRASYQRVYGYYKNARNTYACELIYTAVPNAVITPFINGRYVTEHTYRLGVKTELRLYKKIWTSVTVEIPAGVKGDNNVYIKGSSSYAF